NPLYLSALLASVKHKGVAPTAEEASNLLQIGPEAVSRDVALRLARLPSHAVELLQAAAILGDGSPLDRVAALTSVPGTAALVACAALMSAGLLSSEDPVEFRHPIVRTAVLAHMPASVRLPGYRRAATMLTERGAPAEHAAAYLLDTLPEGDPFTV